MLTEKKYQGSIWTTKILTPVWPGYHQTNSVALLISLCSPTVTEAQRDVNLENISSSPAGSGISWTMIGLLISVL